jgi:regulator of replication initiation timing
MIDIIDTAISTATKIYELVKNMGNADLILEISELKKQLAAINSAYADLQNENTRLKAALSGKGSSVGSARIVRG